MRSEIWLPVVLLIFFISLFMHQSLLSLISFFIFFTGAATRLWNHFCLHRVEFKRTLSTYKAFIGEEIEYELEISNRKILPLPWLQIDDELPEKVPLLKGKAESRIDDKVLLQNVFPIRMYHKIKRRFPMKCVQRGVFQFGPALLRSGDLFGFFSKSIILNKLNYLIVYPRIVPLEKLGIQSKQFSGDMRIKKHLFQDPVLSSSVREYVFGDSLKRIHWKSTARTGSLQTKIFDPTTTMDINIFLDVRTLKQPFWGSNSQLLELGIIAAASISKYAIDNGFRIGLNINQSSKFSRGLASVKSSRHPDQLMFILETLAQVHQSETLRIDQYVRQEAGSIPWASTILVISAQPEERLINIMLELKRHGRSVALVKVGGNYPEITDGLKVYHINDEIAWDLLKEIELDEKTAS